MIWSSLMKTLTSEVLQAFSNMQRDRLDLHVMFESSGNEPAARAQVLDAVEELVREGFLRADGSDFYALTEKGKQELAARNRQKALRR
jgi:DNA-binding PadR family transcriptional regulator